MARKQHTEAIDRMQRERKTICEYCGAEKEGLSFVIGASKTPNWCMVEGTGKMACPVCYVTVGRKEGIEAVNRHVAGVGYQPTTGQRCGCKPGVNRDNCPACEGTGWRIDFARIRART